MIQLNSADKEFKGTGRTIEEALDSARRAALKSLPGADISLDYEVGQISGHYYGFTGENEVTIIIRLLDN